eukprot:1649772-Amphidinium_carterae.4
MRNQRKARSVRNQRKVRSVRNRSKVRSERNQNIKIEKLIYPSCQSGQACCNISSSNALHGHCAG